MEYGKFIKQHRLASGFRSQRQLAEESGVSRTTISRVEKEEQKPSVETLKELAPYLKSTSYVELMVACGYWGEEDLLEPLDYNPTTVKGNRNEINEAPVEYDQHSRELVKNLELSDERILKEFNLELDGKKLTREEAQGIIAYLRSLRSFEK
ncbi:helix-turn-helix domain-containing protein [Oceanobacillus iheyensis]|uniref:helix-turn-helix domain-containing protein n=1 Tax=Oceanobacillus iheyensis TaxID=182710 RepID=UPI00362A86CF